MRTSCSDVIDAIFEHNLGFYFSISPPCTSETAGYLQYLWFRLEVCILFLRIVAELQ